MNYWLHKEAETELGDAAAYYAENASRNIAAAFLEEFEPVAALLTRNQQLGTQKEGNMRTYPFRRFPFSVVFREDVGAGPQIYAVAHHNREPGYWQGRIP